MTAPSSDPTRASGPLPAETSAPRSAADFAAAATSTLDPDVRAWIDGGAGAGACVDRNRAAFAAATIWPSALRGAGETETVTTILGAVCGFPAVVAPMAYYQLAHSGGEQAAAAAAAASGIPFCVSMLASAPLGDIAAAAPAATLWLQLYPLRDGALMRALIQQARASGYKGIVLTVDTPVLGPRPAKFPARPGLLPANLPAGLNYADPAEHAAGAFDPDASWHMISLLESAGLPVVAKGIMTAADAQLATAYGAAAVVVSNHGGRQLEQAPATLEALPHVAEAVGGRVPVLVDGGIRTGADIVTALSHGADAVMIGRPVLHALACDGEQGVRRLLDTFSSELTTTMKLAGATTISQIGSQMCQPAPPTALPVRPLRPCPPALAASALAGLSGHIA